MQAGSLQCPHCGAAVSQDSTQCQYCNALLQTVACAKCMGMMFVGSSFCPHCGVAAQTIAQDGVSKHKCPRCRAAMIAMNVAKTSLEECTHCGGLWIDAKSFDSLCSDAESQTAALGIQLPLPVEIDTHVRYLPCLQCGSLMARLNYAGRSGVVIDICRPHGIWLDRDELRRIIEFIRTGGLDRARQIEKNKLNYDRAQFDRERASQNISDVRWSGSIGHADNVNLACDLIGGLAYIVGQFIRK